MSHSKHSHSFSFRLEGPRVDLAMEDINSWLSFSMDESINHDFAIRRFCPARIEQEQGGDWQDQEALLDEIELYSSDVKHSTFGFFRG